MAGPWEEYQQEEQGPWTEYQTPASGTPRRRVRGGAPMLLGSTTQREREDRVNQQADEYERKVAALDSQDAIGRSMSLTGRAMLKGLAAIPDIVVDPLAKLVNWAGEKPATPSTLITGQRERYFPQQMSIGESVDYFVNRLGGATPQTPGERVYSDVVAGATGAAVPVGIGNQLAQSTSQTVSGVGRLLQSQPTLQLASGITSAGASGTARESGMGPGGQAAAGLLGALAPSAATFTAQTGLRRLARGNNPTQVRSALADFAGVGATPSVGQASGRRWVQGLENLLAASPTAEGVMANAAARQSGQLGSGLERLASGLSRNPSAENAGRAIETGASTFGKNIAATRKALYWQVDQLIPRGTSVQLPNTWRTVVDLTTPVRGAENTTGALINSTIATMRNNLQQDLARGGGQMPYEALKALRSRIGEELDVSILAHDKSIAQYKALYAALSRDLEAAAKAQGPAAERAARRANTFTRVSSERLEDLRRVIDKNGGPEAVFNAALSGTRDGSTTIHKVMQSIDKQQQRAVTAAVIRRMGLANPGAQDAAGDVFSAQTFLTNWNRVSPEAKRALFDRHGPQFSRDMDRVAAVAQNIRDGSSVFRNPSGTGNRTAAIGYWLALGHSLYTMDWKTAGGLAAVGVGANRLAHKMTDPSVVRWLARTTEPSHAGTIAAQLEALRQIGRREDDPEILELADALEEQARNN